MADNHIEFRYTAADVTSAQRVRFLRSGQFRWVALMWGATVIFMLLPVLLPETFTYLPGATWSTAGEVIGVYTLVVVGMLYIIPWLGYVFNRLWHVPLELTINEHQLRLTRSGKGGGLKLAWEDIRRVDETRSVYIFTYSGDQKFFIIPKSAFIKARQEERLRELLARHANLKK
jgi:hypothetical protein